MDETPETPYQRTWRLQQERKAARLKAAQRRKRTKPTWSHNADHIDGYDRDDLGESPDY